MEEKKVLKDEELEKAVGGVGEDDYGTVVCCPRDKCHSKRQGVALYHNGTLEQI